jgi:prepilin-type processing-associated H-X9-DG protein
MGVALLLPAVQAAREAAHRNESANNLKEIGLGILNYEDEHKHLPARAIFDKQGKPLLSWRVLILPQLEEGELYKQFHLDEPWDSEHNKPLIDKMPYTYMHPKFDEPGKTLYQAVVGKGFAFEGTEGTQLASFTDGLAQTIWVVEVSPSKAVPWTKPEDWTPDENDFFKDLGGLFAGDIFNAAFADGHVDGFSTKTTIPTTFKAMLTRNGGEKLPP